MVGIDNFANSSAEVLNRLKKLGGREPEFVEADVRDQAALDAVFTRRPIDAVVHFAALKAVGESTAKPLAYFANNVGGLLSLCEVMVRQRCKALVFSSSATVYGKPERLPIDEDAGAVDDQSVRRDQADERRDPARDRRPPTRNGRSRCCATSTRSAPMRAA